MSEPPKAIENNAETARSACPQCGLALRRVHRHEADRVPTDGVRRHRFQCRDMACGWEGLLPASRQCWRSRVGQDLARVARPAARFLGLAVVLRAGAVAALAIGVPAAVVVVASWGLRLDRQAASQWPAGESHDGRALPLQHPLRLADGGAMVPAGATAETPLTLRQGCAWGQPGRNPYRGSTEQALRQARLPAEVVRDIAARHARHEVSDRLEITTASIRAVAGGREFNPRSFAMTFGRTLCLNARVNFVAGHVEKADLYESHDRQGRRYAVMVPDVCGNVSVLGERGERVPQAQASVAPLAPLPWLQAGPGIQDDGFGLSHALASLSPHQVPEPGTLGLVLAALVAVLVFAKPRS